ncbi:hypothetical protein HZH66_003722 [Vespula vulgaris]|uniref:Uncharacterized protein n=2 Tax=Vespula TaxID=7451 RepID=A0A834KFH7_VESVU|nr:hypothetical protein HZH66_003722 [Vespula vulgaris]
MSLENSDDRRYYTPRYTCKWGYKRVMPTIGSRYVEMSDYIWDVELRLLHWPSWPLIGPPKYIFRWVVEKESGGGRVDGRFRIRNRNSSAGLRSILIFEFGRRIGGLPARPAGMSWRKP